MTDLMTPRGIRNKNPGNIRYDGTLWKGLIGNDGAFCIFDTPENGIRAIAKILLHYKDSGFCTIHQIINRWAPPVENNTTAYVLAVSRSCCINPDQTITQDDYPALIGGIIEYENGEQPYTQSQIVSAIGAAM